MELRFLPTWRIRTTAEFRRVYSKRQRLSGRCYLLYYISNDFGHPRLGVVASKRNVKKAIIRNKVRRIAKESFRKRKHQLPMFDVVFVAKPDAAIANKQELHECINHLFERLVKRSK